MNGLRLVFLCFVGVSGPFVVANNWWIADAPLLAKDAPKSSGGGSPAPGATTIEKLLTQRRDTYQLASASILRFYENGLRTFSDVVQVERQLLEAELELAKETESVAVIGKAVERLAETEKLASERHRAGLAPEVDVLLAKGLRLDAEIHLTREKHYAESVSGVLKELREEHVGVLNQFLESERRKLQLGRSTSWTVHKVEQMALEAALQLSDDHDSRLEILDRALKTARENEKDAEKRAAVGAISTNEVVAYRAARLAAQIRLEKERVSTH